MDIKLIKAMAVGLGVGATQTTKTPLKICFISEFSYKGSPVQINYSLIVKNVVDRDENLSELTEREKDLIIRGGKSGGSGRNKI